MKKIKLVTSMMLMIMMLAVQSAYADTINVGDVIQVYDKTGYGDTTGGPFELYKGSTYQFDTFCLEMNEYLNYGEKLTVTGVTKQAVNGGVGGAVNGADPLSEQTAYLYYNFRINNLSYLTQNTLTPFVYNNEGANALQQAIWFLENELGNTSIKTSAAGRYLGSGTLAYNLVNLANTASAPTLQTAYNNVGVLNIRREDGITNGQDLLTTVPEPATMLLFGLGLVGLAGVRRFIKN